MKEADLTEDAILGGRLRVRQPARGYRVNVDTILLAAAVGMGGNETGARLVELGCGVGGALLSVAARYQIYPETRYFGVERDPRFAALARENVALNGLSGKVIIYEADALSPPPEWGVFDGVFFNPPYDYSSEGRAPAAARSGAHIAELPIKDWIKVWCNRMSYYACLTLIQRPHRLPEILRALEGRLGGVEIFPIRPSRQKPARRLIVRGRKGSRAPLQLWDGLDLHPEGKSKDKYTPQAEAILRGEAFIWSG